MASASRALFLSRALQASAASRSVPTLMRPLPAAAAAPGAAVRCFATQPGASSLRDSSQNWRPAAAAPGAGVRCFATQPGASSLRDSSQNWRPPKEEVIFPGCDYEHWLVSMEPPPGDPSNPDISRDAIIDSYIKTLAQVVGSEEEARQKIYSVSTRHYFAFGALVSEEFYWKLKELPMVRHVSPDFYLDEENKDYGGEPFINGEAVPYDPKYHEWLNFNTQQDAQRDHGGGNPGYPSGDQGYQGQGGDSNDQ